MRAYQKKVVILKETGSKIFEEAHFFLRTGADFSPSFKTMVGEANKIIEESFGKRRGKKRLAAFLIGCVLGVFLGAVITLVLKK